MGELEEILGGAHYQILTEEGWICKLIVFNENRNSIAVYKWQKYF